MFKTICQPLDALNGSVSYQLPVLPPVIALRHRSRLLQSRTDQADLTMGQCRRDPAQRTGAAGRSDDVSADVAAVVVARSPATTHSDQPQATGAAARCSGSRRFAWR